MSDLIERQAAIDAFTGVVILEPAQSAKKYIDGVIERIQNLPSVQPEQRWIPCSERLPEKEGWYITTVESEKTGKRRIENDLFAIDIALAHGHIPNKFCKDGYRQRTVAWCEFPEPWRGDADEKI